MMSAGTSDKQRVPKRQRNVRLAQLDRAFGYGPKGRGFESSNARTITVLVKTRAVFSLYGKLRLSFLQGKKPSGQESTAAERKDVAGATCRRAFPAGNLYAR